jgi:hypothetical protein
VAMPLVMEAPYAFLATIYNHQRSHAKTLIQNATKDITKM